MVEVLSTTIGNIPIALMAAVLAGLLRSIAGWLENSLKDGIISEYEWRQLAGTIVQYFAYIVLLMLGIDSASQVLGHPANVSISTGLATSLAFLLDATKSSLNRVNTIVTTEEGK